MKNILSRLLCACTLCMAGNMAFAQNKILLDDSFQNEAVTMEVLESSPSKYTLKVQIHGLFDNQISNSRGNFHWLSFGLDGHLPKVGYPSLPLITRFLAIPSEANCSASISEVKWTDVEMGRIYPTQPPRNDDENIPEFVLNDTAYSMPFTPAILSSGREMKWRDIKNVTLTVCPFKYDATQNRLSILTEFVLQVNFLTERGTPVADNYVKKVDEYRLFDNDIYVENEQNNLRDGNNSDDYDYLIIIGTGTNIALTNSDLQDFRVWKAMKGFKTKAVTTATTGTSTSSIKSYIEQEYTNHHIKYVLFVGDEEHISTEVKTFIGYDDHNNPYTIYVHSDYYYGCMNNNSYLASIPIGRFPVDYWWQFKNMVQKTMDYENDVKPTKKILMVANQYGYPEYPMYEICSDSIIQRTTNPMHYSFYRCYGDSSSASGHHATNADIINHINNNKMQIVNYRGHGGVNSWNEWNANLENFTSNHIQYIDSTSRAVYFSVACNTGHFIDSDTCMMEAFTRAPYGAVSFVGSTVSSDSEANDYYDKFLFKKLLKDSLRTLGDLNLAAHLQTLGLAFLDDRAERNALSYICGGDPTLDILKCERTPIPNSVIITPSNGTITVNAHQNVNYTVCIATEDGEMVDKFTTNNPIFTFTQPADKFYLSITKKNYKPYVAYVDTESNDVSITVPWLYNCYYFASPMAIGGGDPDHPTGCYLIKDGAKYFVKNGNGGVLLYEEVEVEKGASLEIE